MATASCLPALRPDSPFSPAPPITLPPAGLPTRRGDGGAGDFITGYTPPSTPGAGCGYEHAATAAAGEPCMGLALVPTASQHATPAQACAPSQSLVPVAAQTCLPLPLPLSAPPLQSAGLPGQVPWVPSYVPYAHNVGEGPPTPPPQASTPPGDPRPALPWLPTTAPTLYTAASRNPTPPDSARLALAPYTPQQQGPKFSDSVVSLRPCRSRELIHGDIIKCTCSKRNGLQDDCRHMVCASPDCIYRVPQGSVYWSGQGQKPGQGGGVEAALPAGQTSTALALKASGAVMPRRQEEEHLHGPGAVPMGDGPAPPFAPAYAHAALPPAPMLAPPQAQGDAKPCTAMVPYNPQWPGTVLNNASPTFAEYQTHLANIYSSLEYLNRCLREINQKALGPYPVPPGGGAGGGGGGGGVGGGGGMGAPGPPQGMSVSDYTQAVGNIANNLGELQNKLGLLNNTVFNPNNPGNANNPLFLDTSVYMDPRLAGAYGLSGGSGGGGGGYLVGGAGDGGQWYYPQTWHAHAYPMGMQQAANAQHHSWPGAQAAWEAATSALTTSQPLAGGVGPPGPAAAYPVPALVPALVPAAAWPSPGLAGGSGGETVRGPDNVPFKSCNGL